MASENWELLLKEYGPLLGRTYVDEGEVEYVFFGLVHGDDDYFFGLESESGKLELLSCVGDIENYGYTLVEE